MLDIALIRSKPDWVKEQIAKLNDEGALARIDTILQMDLDRREARTQIETAQAARNKLNRAMGKLRGNKKMDEREKAARAMAAVAALGTEDFDRASAIMDGSHNLDHDGEAALQAAFDELIRELRIMGDEIGEGFSRVEKVEAELQENMLWLPNLPHESVPVFDSEEHNVAGQMQGALREFDFDPKPHWEIGPALGIIDFERGVKLSGSRHYILEELGGASAAGAHQFLSRYRAGEWLYRSLRAIHRAWRDALWLGAIPQVSGHCIWPRRG